MKWAELSHAFNDMGLNLKVTIATMVDERSNLAAVLANLTDRVVMTNGDKRIILANPSAERLFNFRETNVIGHPLIEAVHDYEIDEVVKNAQNS